MRHVRSTLLILLIGSSWLFSTSPSAQAQLGKPEALYYKSWAIVIGIENYVLAPRIPGAIEDAKRDIFQADWNRPLS